MGEKTFQALLMSNIETLSAWNAEHDSPNSPYESIHLFIRKNPAALLKLWATFYKMTKRVKGFWLSCFLTLQLDRSFHDIKDAMILASMFDRAQYSWVMMNESQSMSEPLKQLLTLVVEHASPKLMVGILGALLFECENLSMTTFFITESARVSKIHWHEAIVYFGDSLDLWLKCKQQLAQYRRAYHSYYVPVLIPFGYSSLADGAFPWSAVGPIISNPHLVPITFGSYFYRHRTMEQVHKICHVLLSIPYRIFRKGSVPSPLQ